MALGVVGGGCWNGGGVSVEGGRTCGAGMYGDRGNCLLGRAR